MPAQAIHHINIRAHKTLVAELKDFYEGVDFYYLFIKSLGSQ